MKTKICICQHHVLFYTNLTCDYLLLVFLYCFFSQFDSWLLTSLSPSSLHGFILCHYLLLVLLDSLFSQFDPWLRTSFSPSSLHDFILLSAFISFSASEESLVILRKREGKQREMMNSQIRWKGRTEEWSEYFNPCSSSILSWQMAQFWRILELSQIGR